MRLSQIAIFFLVVTLTHGCATADRPAASTHALAPKNISCDRTEIARVGSVPIWDNTNCDAFFFVAGMSISANGTPNAYHPDSRRGLDHLGNAGRPYAWWGLLTEDANPAGVPLVQGPHALNPGFYVSTTALQDRSHLVIDPRRYVNARHIPYIAMPGSKDVLQKTKARLGDIAMVINLETGATSGAIFADIGPRNVLGEGSIALAKALGIPSDPRTGGTEGRVLYVVFARSGKKRPQPAKKIAAEASRLFATWGGMEKASACLAPQ